VLAETHLAKARGERERERALDAAGRAVRASGPRADSARVAFIRAWLAYESVFSTPVATQGRDLAEGRRHVAVDALHVLQREPAVGRRICCDSRHNSATGGRYLLGLAYTAADLLPGRPNALSNEAARGCRSRAESKQMASGQPD